MQGRPGEVVRAAFEIAERMGATVAQVALQWIMTHPEITVVITGADNAEQLDNNIGAVDLRLAEEDLAELSRLSEGLSVTGW
jgi:aryl-alcohol dehydrogenase-like predicted oxidoreductase